ncbi:MAG: beta-lactamase family protein [Euryarchaeota archaeon]|nr:beta-lactamase family protein [Euryarchaeota archaeon]
MARGIDSIAMANLEQHVSTGLPMVRSVLVSCGGSLTYEKYFGHGRADERVNVWSCTKSFVSMLVGILIKDGAFPALSDPVAKILPDVAKKSHKSFRAITVRDVLTMRMGYDLEFGDYDVLGTIGSPPTTAPGTAFCYNDVGPHIISMMISEVTGKTASEFADETIFKESGIVDPPWTRARDGHSIGGYGLLLTPREMLGFGGFALARGRANGKQLVDDAFFEESISPQSDGGFPGGNRYGYFWWVSDRGGTRTHYALGFGGQLICVAPEKQLVAVVTCTDDLGADIGPVQDIYFDRILPACE